MLRSQDQRRRGPLATVDTAPREDTIGPPSSAAAPEIPPLRTATSFSLLRRPRHPGSGRCCAWRRRVRRPLSVRPGVSALPPGHGPTRLRQADTNPTRPGAAEVGPPAEASPAQAASEKAAVARFWDRYYGSFSPPVPTGPTRPPPRSTVAFRSPSGHPRPDAGPRGCDPAPARGRAPSGRRDPVEHVDDSKCDVADISRLF